MTQHSSEEKIGFWPVFGMVTGSQIGSGIFMLPLTLAPFGFYSLIGWGLSTLGAIALCIVFASLCAILPKTGGPHVYVQNAFGKEAGFFVGWTYWMISWISTTLVVVACIGYISPFIPEGSRHLNLLFEMALVLLFMGLNLYGIQAAAKFEVLLTILKVLPLFIIPLAAFMHFDTNNFIVATHLETESLPSILGKVTLLTLWGFIGLESATTPAESVKNPETTIPKAIIWGTSAVALLYIFNSVGIMGLLNGNELAQSEAPYVAATKKIFGGNWHLLVSIAASLVCMGTLNAWIITSSQIFQGLTKDGFFPAWLSKKDEKQKSLYSVFASTLGIFPLLVMTYSDQISQQINTVIDFSVMAFLYVYLICTISYFKLHAFKQKRIWPIAVGLVASGFCLWIISSASWQTHAVSLLFTLSGIPVFILWKKN